MTPSLEPLAIAFANTRSSSDRDRIATVEQVRRWAQPWPALSGLRSSLDAAVLGEIRALRDAAQSLLHDLAQARTPSAELLDRVTRPGLASDALALRVTADGRITVGHEGTAAAAVLHLLSRGLVDFLISPQVERLRRCEGTHCYKVFVGQRSNRRWCESRICGNRARVAAHARSSANRRESER